MTAGRSEVRYRRLSRRAADRRRMVRVPQVLGPVHDGAAAMAAEPLGRAGARRRAKAGIAECRPERHPDRGEQQQHRDRRGSERMTADNGAPGRPDLLLARTPAAPGGQQAGAASRRRAVRRRAILRPAAPRRAAMRCGLLRPGSRSRRDGSCGRPAPRRSSHRQMRAALPGDCPADLIPASPAACRAGRCCRAPARPTATDPAPGRGRSPRTPGSHRPRGRGRKNGSTALTVHQRSPVIPRRLGTDDEGWVKSARLGPTGRGCRRQP